jgi:hypothetical protein
MIIKGWRHAPPSFNSFTDFEVVTNFCTRWRKRIRVDEMKVQINLRKRPNERLDSTSTRSSEKLNLKGEVIVSFFNELDTGKELCSRPLFHFLTSFPQRRKTMLIGSRFNPHIFVSFFNDLATERKLCS